MQPRAAPLDVSSRLYRAAIGPRGQARYLALFARFDAAGRAGPSWHWAACVSALNWLAARGLWALAWGWAASALLGSVAALGLARLLFDLDDGQLALLFAALALLASLAWGLGADALYYRSCNRRILAAVAASRGLDEACRLLAQAAGPRQRWAQLLALDALLLLAVGLCAQWLWPRTPAAAVPAGRPVLADTVAVPTPAASAAADPASTPAGPAEPAPPAAAAPEAEVAPAAPAASTPALPAAAPAPAPPPRKTAQAAERPQGGFAVQIGVFAQADNVRKVLETLRGARLQAYAEAANPPAAEPQRVRAGPYATREQAQQAAERIRALALPAVVVRLRAPDAADAPAQR